MTDFSVSSNSPVVKTPFNTTIPSCLPSLKKTFKGWGIVLAFFGQALRVEQTNGSVSYVKIEELKKKFLLNRFTGLNQSDMKKVQKDAIIHDLFLSTINPLKGTAVKQTTLKKLHHVAVNLKYQSDQPKDTYKSLRKIKATIYSKKGMTDDQKQFISVIKVGDILYHRTDESVSSSIVLAQTIASKLGLGPKHRDALHHNHAYMCAKIDEQGKKWFAEAAWPTGKQDEIRLVSEDDLERCFIKQNRGAVSEIFRFKDQAVAKKAAQEACQITTPLLPQDKGSKEIQPTELRYSIMQGVQALFSSNRFGHMAKTRLIQQVRSSTNGQKPTDFISPKGFFCSSLVGYTFQVAEARSTVEGFSENSKKRHGLKHLFQSHFAALKHKKLLDQKITFKIDPKRSTPADMYSWICENPQLFSSIQAYQQPTLNP